MSKNICTDCKKISLEPIEVQDHGYVCLPCSKHYSECEFCNELAFTLEETNYNGVMCDSCIEATSAEDNSFRVIKPDAWKGERDFE